MHEFEFGIIVKIKTPKLQYTSCKNIRFPSGETIKRNGYVEPQLE